MFSRTGAATLANVIYLDEHLGNAGNNEVRERERRERGEREREREGE